MAAASTTANHMSPVSPSKLAAVMSRAIGMSVETGSVKLARYRALCAERFELRLLPLQFGAQVLPAFRDGGALDHRVSPWTLVSGQTAP
jgi:hypothetical protein